jgi:hypothetical protein
MKTAGEIAYAVKLFRKLEPSAAASPPIRNRRRISTAKLYDTTGPAGHAPTLHPQNRLGED